MKESRSGGSSCSSEYLDGLSDVYNLSKLIQLCTSNICRLLYVNYISTKLFVCFKQNKTKNPHLSGLEAGLGEKPGRAGP